MRTTIFWNAVLLATGTMIGVGLLAVPILTGLAGFIPGLALALLAAFMMWLSGMLLAERAMDLRRADADIASLYAADIGRWVRWITMPAYLLLFHAILVAYLTGGAGILSSLPGWSLSLPHAILFAFAFCSLFMVFGQKVMLHCNGMFVALMTGSFMIMLFAAAGHITGENLSRYNLPLAAGALPVLCCAFAYHNVIPLICRHLDHDRRAVRLALTLALLIAFALTASWLLVVVGALPATGAEDAPSLLNAYREGRPATVPLAAAASSRLIASCAVAFSLLAILTSYIGVGAALSSFMRDICPGLRPARRAPLLFGAVFLPPLGMALFKPDAFLAVIDLVGGFGVIILFGILPTVAFARTRTAGRLKLKILVLVMLVFYLLVFAVEAGKLMGLMAPA